MKTTYNISIGARRTISPHEVILLTADINYTQVYLSDGLKITVATTLKELEKRFSACSEFFRTHKSSLINLNHVTKYHDTGNEVFVQMKNDYRVVISRRKKEAFEKYYLSVKNLE